VSEGRIFRQVDGRWDPVGSELPVWAHVPPRPNQSLNVWVLPKGEGYAARDMIVFGETAHRLLSPVPPGDVAWNDTIDAALALHSPADVREWVTHIELWLALRQDKPWASGRPD